MLLLTLFISLLSFSTGPSVTAEEVPTQVYLSTNQGGTWEPFGTGMPTDVEPRDLVEHQKDLYLSTHMHGVFVLRSNATTWAPIREGLPYAEAFFLPTSLAVNGEIIVLGTYQHGVYFSRDGGGHWQEATIDIPRAARALLFTENGLWAGTDRGLYRSFDNGDTWFHFGDDHSSIINALTIHNDQLFVVRQNGMGVLKNDEVRWSEVQSDWALTQATSAGKYAYATSVRGEVFRSIDGVSWEAKPAFPIILSCNSLSEARWYGFEPELPGAQTSGMLYETSRGWVALVGGGC